MQTAFQFLRESEALMNSTGFQTRLTPEIYDSNLLHRLQTDGYVIDDILATVNANIPPPVGNESLAYQGLLNMDMNILAGGLTVRPSHLFYDSSTEFCRCLFRSSTRCHKTLNR